MGGAWWKLSGGYGRCEDVRVGRCVHSGFVLPHGRVCFGQGESPVKLFAKLFGKSAREGSDNAHRPPSRTAPRTAEEQGASARCSGTRSAVRAVTFRAVRARRLLTLPQSGRIGFGNRQPQVRGPSSSRGQPRQEDPSMSALVCTRCGTPQRGGQPVLLQLRCAAAGRGARRASVRDDLHDLHLRPRGLRRRGHRPDADARRSPRRRRPPSTRCRSAPRCWWCAAVRTRAAASCWTAS